MSLNKEAFLRYMEEHKGIIYKICRSYCQDKDAREDLAQEIMYHLWKSFHSYKADFTFSTWMYRIALNVAISFYRKERKFSEHTAIPEELIIMDNQDESAEREDNITLLEQFIMELGEIERSIMLLYLDDKSHKEISAITGISETNVATKINRIKIKLRTSFALQQNN